MLNQIKFRQISIFLTIVLLLGLVIAVGNNFLKTGNVVAEAGDLNVGVPVDLENNESVAGLQFEVSYTTFLTFKNFELTSRMPNATVEINNDTNGLLKIAVLVEDKISVGNGTIMNLIFDVNESAVPGNYTTNLSEILVGNINTSIIPIDKIEGTFSIVKDTDGDGIFDANDSCPNIPGIGGEFEGCPQWIILHTGNPTLEVSGSKINFTDGFFHSNGPITISGSDNNFTHNVTSNKTITNSGSNNNAPAFNSNEALENFDYIDCGDLTNANWTFHPGKLTLSDSNQVVEGNLVVQGIVEISGSNITINGGIAATNKITLSGGDININSEGLALCTNQNLVVSGSENNINGISHVLNSAKLAGSKNNFNSVVTDYMIDKVSSIPGSENNFKYNITNWEHFDFLKQQL